MIDKVNDVLSAEFSNLLEHDSTGVVQRMNLHLDSTFPILIAKVLSYHLSWGHIDVQLSQTLIKLLQDHTETVRAMVSDLTALRDRDQACYSLLDGILFRKGYQALAVYRIAHLSSTTGDRLLPRFLHHRCSVVFNVDIHPKASLEEGIVIDHGSGLVIGETAVVGRGSYLFHGVTLGSTGNQKGQRHPILHRNTFIGAGASVLGAIEIGEGAVVAAGSVVTRSVAAGSLVGGIPAKDIGPAPVLLPPKARQV